MFRALPKIILPALSLKSLIFSYISSLVLSKNLQCNTTCLTSSIVYASHNVHILSTGDAALNLGSVDFSLRELHTSFERSSHCLIY